MHERYPALWQLLAGYFHQVWLQDHLTADDPLTTRDWLVHVGEFLERAA